MTRIELQKMIAQHEALKKRATDALNNRYDELEARKEVIDWLEEYLRQEIILDWLHEQLPDD